MIRTYYDALAPYYHLIYEDWEADIRTQAIALDRIIRDFWGDARTILDAACGIGTQSLGLAQLGYEVVGSDISGGAIERAKREAARRGLNIDFRLADMRKLSEVWTQQFDVVIACDNAIPHLLSDEEILAALRQLHLCTRPGGGCIISVRDYAKMELGGKQMVPRTVHDVGRSTIVMFDVWEFDGDIYEMSTYIIEDTGEEFSTVRVLRARYYCVTIDRLEALMFAAGYANIQTMRDRFFQPLIIGTKQVAP